MLEIPKNHDGKKSRPMADSKKCCKCSGQIAGSELPVYIDHDPARRVCSDCLSNILRENEPPVVEECDDDDTRVARALLSYYIKGRDAASKSIGRYKGWVLVDYGYGKSHVSKRYVQVKAACELLGCQLIKWSSISQNIDDDDEYGINLLGSF